jgi:hypothetical protein
MGKGQLRTRARSVAATLVAGLLGMAGAAGATSLPFSTDELGEYLIVGMGPVNDAGPSVGVGQASNTNNFELGANKAPVPSTSDFLDSGGGPTLEGAVPPLPSDIEPVFQGISGDGNVAITHEDGVFNFQDVGVYADPGIDCAAATAADCDDGTSNSFYNDPNQFPNTFDTGTQTGLNVNPGDADQSTRIDAGNFAGVNAGVDFTILLDDVADAKTEIPNLVGTSVLDLSDGNVAGTIKPDNFGDVSGSGLTLSTPDANTLAITFTTDGLHVVDIDTDGNDFKLDNMNLVIDGPAGALVIFRLPSTGGVTDQNMLISNSSIFVGDGGMGLESVVFFSNRDGTGQHFNFSNTIVNGAAFWSLGMAGGEINIDNAQGCTQLVADKITLNDVRFTRCAFGASVPEPSLGVLLSLAALGLLGALGRSRTGG